MTTEKKNSPENSRPRVNTLTSLLLLAMIACLVATLFTVWIPDWYLQEAVALPTYVIPDMNQVQSEEIEFLPTPTTAPVVGIVAGHMNSDMSDPGAVCPDALGGVKEVEVNLAVASKVIDLLKSQGFEAELLEEFDDRLQDFRGLALVSIHADSCEYINDEARGFKVAATWANPNSQDSNYLVACMEKRYAERTGMQVHLGSVTNDMTNYHAFAELNPITPAAIIEIGFLNRDNDRLRNDQDTLAQGVTDGILCYLRNENIVSPTTTPAP